MQSFLIFSYDNYGQPWSAKTTRLVTVAVSVKFNGENSDHRLRKFPRKRMYNTQDNFLDGRILVNLIRVNIRGG
jgi:hypothetical protein